MIVREPIRLHAAASSSFALVAFALLMLMLLVGCIEERIVYDGWAEFPQDPKPAQGVAAFEQGGYTILLATYTGDERQREAYAALRDLVDKANVDNAWVDDVGPTCQIYRGRFRKKDEKRALHMLEGSQRLLIDGKRPFRKAKMTPLPKRSVYTLDPLDARQFPGRFTLQIGFYDPSFDGDFRAAAEQAVRTLRKDGHEAYFYHGRHRSLITLGLFTRGDFSRHGTRDAYQDSYGPRIRALQQMFPHNLGNGLTIKERVDNKDIGEQPSFVVRIY